MVQTGIVFTIIHFTLLAAAIPADLVGSTILQPDPFESVTATASLGQSNDCDSLAARQSSLLPSAEIVVYSAPECVFKLDKNNFGSTYFGFRKANTCFYMIGSGGTNSQEPFHSIYANATIPEGITCQLSMYRQSGRECADLFLGSNNLIRRENGGDICILSAWHLSSHGTL